MLVLNGGTNTDDVRWRANLQRPATRNGGTLQYRELASGITANVNAMARVGLLFLRKGMWKDQRVLSRGVRRQVHTPLPENAGLRSIEPTAHSFPNAHDRLRRAVVDQQVRTAWPTCRPMPTGRGDSAKS